jgi:hypothetical protein
LKKISESFVFTTLNMLHSRVQYPDQEESGGSAPAKAEEHPPAPQNKPAPVTKPITAVAHVPAPPATA